MAGFAGGRRARAERRFSNLRSESYWRLRDLLDQDLIGIPEDEDLWAELLATTWAPDASGRVAITAKDELRNRLGRSPDKADAVSMLFSTFQSPRAAPAVHFAAYR